MLVGQFLEKSTHVTSSEKLLLKHDLSFILSMSQNMIEDLFEAPAIMCCDTEIDLISCPYSVLL
jgi:hypothetical protein